MGHYPPKLGQAVTFQAPALLVKLTVALVTGVPELELSVQVCRAVFVPVVVAGEVEIRSRRSWP